MHFPILLHHHPPFPLSCSTTIHLYSYLAPPPSTSIPISLLHPSFSSVPSSRSTSIHFPQSCSTTIHFTPHLAPPSSFPFSSHHPPVFHLTPPPSTFPPSSTSPSCSTTSHFFPQNPNISLHHQSLSFQLPPHSPPRSTTILTPIALSRSPIL
ncbi:hypothetical protein Pcinc_030361 [Petrolisthes cinctipes]|uniref:Uncharacterized protein n=1 Tax=Petrolisthes cinctipes TaxID=88211 RepID=A0AAE1K658_PETCI|nr:hypothetical protein Pcinc_030361 [Petrolisthes cinctipes]